MSNAQRTGAYNEGKAAGLAGTPSGDNPHKTGENSLRRAWNWGWIAGRDEKTAADNEAAEAQADADAERDAKTAAHVKMAPETTVGVADGLLPGQTVSTVTAPEAVEAHPDSTKAQEKAAEVQEKVLNNEPVNLDDLAKDLGLVQEETEKEPAKKAAPKAPAKPRAARKPAAKKAAPKAEDK